MELGALEGAIVGARGWAKRACFGPGAACCPPSTTGRLRPDLEKFRHSACLANLTGAAPCTASNHLVHAWGTPTPSKSPPPSWQGGSCPGGRGRWCRWAAACVPPAAPAAAEPDRRGARGGGSAFGGAAAAAPPRRAQSCSANRICSTPAATCVGVRKPPGLAWSYLACCKPWQQKRRAHPPIIGRMRPRSAGRQRRAAPSGKVRRPTADPPCTELGLGIVRRAPEDRPPQPVIRMWSAFSLHAALYPRDSPGGGPTPPPSGCRGQTPWLRCSVAPPPVFPTPGVSTIPKKINKKKTALWSTVWGAVMCV